MTKVYKMPDGLEVVSLVEFHMMKAKLRKLESRLAYIELLVAEQAEDEGLWFNSKLISEEMLQVALRDLHRRVEEE